MRRVSQPGNGGFCMQSVVRGYGAGVKREQVEAARQTNEPSSSSALSLLVVDDGGRIEWLSDSMAARNAGLQVGRLAAEVLGADWLGPRARALEALRKHGVWSSRTTHRGPDGDEDVIVVARQRQLGGQPIGLSVEVMKTDAPRSGPMAYDRLLRLQAIGTRLISARTQADVAHVVCDEAAPAVGAYGATMAVLGDDGLLRVVGSVGYPVHLVQRWEVLRGDEGVPLTDAVARDESVWLATLEERNAQYPALRAVTTPTQSMCAVPLRLDGPAFGAIGFSFADQRSFDRPERNFLLAVAHHCALALDRIRQPRPAVRAAPGRVVIDGEHATGPAVRRVLEEVRGTLTDALVEDAKLCASELVTNAIVHTGGPLRVRIENVEDGIRIEVDDVAPELRAGATHDDIGGWGLQIVSGLADRWGVTVQTWGKTVWAEVHERVAPAG
jgi:hypothetical protein